MVRPRRFNLCVHAREAEFNRVPQDRPTHREPRMPGRRALCDVIVRSNRGREGRVADGPPSPRVEALALELLEEHRVTLRGPFCS
jgi:hypothetical protein